MQITYARDLPGNARDSKSSLVTPVPPHSRTNSDIYLDEDHNVHDSTDRCPVYQHLHILCQVDRSWCSLLFTSPLPFLSATKKSLETSTGLKTDYAFINLGNQQQQRISLIVRPMGHPASTFWDLAWVLLLGTRIGRVFPQALVHCDDLVLVLWVSRSYKSSCSIGSIPSMLEFPGSGHAQQREIRHD